MSHVIVGFAGQFMSGKDVAADHLNNKLNEIYPNGWRRDALAGNVKRIFMETFGVDREFIEKWKRTQDIPDGFQMAVRQALTFIGDGFREIRQDVWIDLFMKSVTKHTILSDIRYVNEVNYFSKRNGVSILMWRPGFENDFPNASEQELMPFVKELTDTDDGVIDQANIPFDLWIRNDGTLEDLHDKVDNLVVPYIVDKIES